MHHYTKDMIRKGMLVRLASGKTLGKVIDVNARSFVADGASDKVDYVADYDQISAINGDEIVLLQRDAKATAEFEDYKDNWKGEWSEKERLSLAEEQLDVQKHVKKAGEVRLRKRVITERKTMTVPVMTEQVRIERVPASSDTAAKAAFTDSTIRVPLEKEEVDVVKRPVVREEVVVKKDRVVQEQRVAADVRREELEVEGDQNVTRTPSTPGKSGWRGPGSNENL